MSTEVEHETCVIFKPDGVAARLPIHSPEAQEFLRRELGIEVAAGTDTILGHTGPSKTPDLVVASGQESERNS